MTLHQPALTHAVRTVANSEIYQDGIEFLSRVEACRSALSVWRWCDMLSHAWSAIILAEIAGASFFMAHNRLVYEAEVTGALLHT